MNELTPTQTDVFGFVRDKLLNGHSAPTLRELGKAFGWSSPRAAACHLDAIIRKGWLVREPGKARALRLPPNSNLERRSMVDIPIYGSIPAGFADTRRQEAKGCASIDIGTLGVKPSPLAFGLEVKGDSMIGRHIAPGDLVIIEPRCNPKNGDVVAALIDGDSTLKTLVVRGSKTYLRAENPKYPDPAPADELVIQGVAIAVVRKLR